MCTEGEIDNLDLACTKVPERQSARNSRGRRKNTQSNIWPLAHWREVDNKRDVVLFQSLVGSPSDKGVVFAANVVDNLSR